MSPARLPTRSPADPSERLWRDPRVFEERYERTAAAALAVARALRRRAGLVPGGGAAVRLHDFLAALEPRARDAVWTDPYAHLWARLAYELLGAVLRGESLPRAARAWAAELGTDDPHSVLEAHLAQLGRLAVGGALAAGRDLALPTPLRLALPTAVPGTALAMVGGEGGEAVLCGVRDGRVQAAQGAPPRLVACPRARVRGAELPLQPHGAAVPGIGWAPAAARTSLAFQEGQRPRVERALERVARHQPESFAQMRRHLRWLAVNPVSDVGETNASDSNLPGAIVVMGFASPWALAAACIHELHHHRLFGIEESDGVLAGDALGPEDDARHYSPWREDPRPLRGLLHGVYVYVPEQRFWLAVARAQDTPEPARRLARDRLVRTRLQLELALEELDRAARFTPAGAELYAQLAADARAVCAESRAVVPGDAPAVEPAPDGSVVPRRSADGARSMTAREVVADHARRFGGGRALSRPGEPLPA